MDTELKKGIGEKLQGFITTQGKLHYSRKIIHLNNKSSPRVTQKDGQWPHSN